MKKANSNNSQSAGKKKINFVSMKESENAKVDDFDINNGQLWLKKGNYEACGVSIKVDENTTLSDWMRMIELKNVHVSVRENDKGYPQLIISGQSEDIPF